MTFFDRYIKTLPKTHFGGGERVPNVLAIFRDAGILVLILSMLIPLWPLRRVPTGYRGVITVGGAIRGIEAEGFILVAPWQILDVFNIRAESVDIKDAEGATKDTQPIKVSMTVRYSVIPNKVALVFEQFSKDGNLDHYVITATQETFKAITARYSATDLIEKRTLVSADILDLLRQKIDKFGAQIISVDMTNFAFAPQYMAAINEKANQEQLRLAAERAAETVKSQQKAKVEIALADARIAREKANGDADAQLTIAKAQAEALKIQATALAQSQSILELRRIEVERIRAEAMLKWDGKLPTQMFSGDPIPLLDIGKTK